MFINKEQIKKINILNNDTFNVGGGLNNAISLVNYQIIVLI